MQAIVGTEHGSPEVLQPKEAAKDNEAFTELVCAVQAALETYANVHRGSGHNSMVSTHLYDQARDVVLTYLGLNKDKYVVIFGTPRRAVALEALLKPGSYHSISSQDTGLPLGLRAVAVEKKALPPGTPFQTGGGTARLVFPDRVIWARGVEKFEAGTPAIINVIAFAKALQLMQRFGKDAFRHAAAAEMAPSDILYHDDLDEYSGQELLARLLQSLIGRGIRVPTADGARPFINLDNGASTPTFARVWDAVCQTWRQPRHGQQAIVQEVRSICAGVLAAPLADYDVIFASNTTEAINLVAESLAKEATPDVEPVVLNTGMEHNSNELPWRTVPGMSLLRLAVDNEGFIDMGELETLLSAYNQDGQHGKQRITLVAVSGASNVLGTFNDLAEISRIVHRYGARVLVDAAQMVAHRRIEMDAWGIDYLAFSAHKAYAPFGSGALVVRKGLLRFSPAEMESIRASGEENAGGIAALGKALLLLQRIGFDVVQQDEQALTRRALRGMAQIPGLTVFGVKDPDSPRFARKGGVVIFDMKAKMAPGVAKQLAEQGGIGVRAGCHCAHLLVKRLVGIGPRGAQFQGVLVTLFPHFSLPGVTRVSLGIENTEEDIDRLIEMLGRIAQKEHGKRATPGQVDVHKQMEEFTQAAARRVYTQLN